MGSQDGQLAAFASEALRDEAAALREEVIANREHLASTRERAIEQREILAALRETSVLEREATADGRDAFAHRRDALAVSRDERATQADEAASARDLAAVGFEQEHGAGMSSRLRQVLAENRSSAAGDRERAAGDRGSASGDRSVALDDRVASASDRLAAANDRASTHRANADLLGHALSMTSPNPPSSFVLEDRNRSADDRDRTSYEHDRSAEARDARSDARDARASGRDEDKGHIDADAAADRAGAKRDRQVSAGDRKHAEDDRDAASADRILAAVDRANLVIDGLTGARNREAGLVELERELVKARRTGHPLVLAFVDVDGLKAINDTQGHQTGDDVLRQVVAAVRKVVREYDLIVRYGGDEFICGLGDLDLDDAADRFAKAREDLAGHGVTFSVGLAVLEVDETLSGLVNRADRAMYEQRKSREMWPRDVNREAPALS